jgi:hypothetical protein
MTAGKQHDAVSEEALNPSGRLSLFMGSKGEATVLNTF